MSNILLLESDPSLLELLTTAIREFGHTVSGALSFDAAVRSCAKHPYDLVITSSRSAGGRGLESVATLKKLHPALKGLLISGQFGGSERASSLEQSIDVFLYKPFDLAQLRRAIDDCLNESSVVLVVRSFSERLCCSFQAVAAAWATWRRDSWLAGIDAQRDRLVESFCCGIHEQSLGVVGALNFYDLFEELEAGREQVRAGKRSGAYCAKLRKAYGCVAAALQAHCRRRPIETPGKRQAGTVSREHFEKLYCRVARGELGSEMIKIAPRLRVAVIAGNVEPSARALYQSIWESESLAGTASEGNSTPLVTNRRNPSPLSSLCQPLSTQSALVRVASHLRKFSSHILVKRGGLA